MNVETVLTYTWTVPVSQNITVQPVNTDNWRNVCALQVTGDQRAFVAEPSYYLALCCYDTWNPLAIYLDNTVVGFMMWGIDDDGSCWLGGILIDQKHQNKGYGRKAVREVVTVLSKQNGATGFALSYQPANATARHLYGSMGFVETGEQEDDEAVARLTLGSSPDVTP